MQNGHQATAIAFATWSVWVIKIKIGKNMQKRIYNYIIVVLCKKRIENTANVGEMRGF